MRPVPQDFAYGPSLKIHIERVQERRCYSCNQCDITMSIIQSLKEHLIHDEVHLAPR